MNLLTPTVQVARGTAGTPMTTWTRPSARFVIVATIRNAANVANKTSTKNLTLTSLIILFMSLIQINLKNVSHAGWGWHQQLLCQDLRWEAIKKQQSSNLKVEIRCSLNMLKNETIVLCRRKVCCCQPVHRRPVPQSHRCLRYQPGEGIASEIPTDCSKDTARQNFDT